MITYDYVYFEGVRFDNVQLGSMLTINNHSVIIGYRYNYEKDEKNNAAESESE